jgi:hypothetical protein
VIFVNESLHVIFFEALKKLCKENCLRWRRTSRFSFWYGTSRGESRVAWGWQPSWTSSSWFWWPLPWLPQAIGCRALGCSGFCQQFLRRGEAGSTLKNSFFYFFSLTKRPSQDPQLAENSLHFLVVLAHHVHGSSSLAVETHVLGVGLADEHIEPWVREQPHALGINVDVTARESLKLTHWQVTLPNKPCRRRKASGASSPSP